MNAYSYLAVLFCLVGLGIHVSASTPPPLNPECSGMNKIAKRLDKGTKTFTKETTNCRVNNACTGLMCNGTHQKNDFYMKMELKHCKTPPKIQLDLIFQDINFHKEMKNGPYVISKKSPLGSNVKLKLTLTKNRNRITTGFEVLLCPILNTCTTLFTMLPQTTFCLNMKACPGYNSTGDEPCHLSPTGINSVSPTSVTTTVDAHSSLRAEKRGSHHHHITAAVAAGIGLACLTAVLIMVAAAYYWKRFYRRSRLRAAYYNDISMNDPLYEDFGPEEA